MSTESTTDPLRAVGSDAGLGFERAMTAAKKRAFAAHMISSARIIVGVWSESELCPAMQEYVNQHRHLYTPAWIKPNAKDHSPIGAVSASNPESNSAAAIG